MLAIFLDLEATGLDPSRHHVIDIAFEVIDVTSNAHRGSFQSIVTVTPEEWAKHDPNSLHINGFTWKDVCQGQSPNQVGQQIIALFDELKIERGRAVFICQNPAFDRGFFTQLVDIYTQERLHWPYHWLDLASMYWASIEQKCLRNHIPFPESINLSKNEIARAYQLPPEVEPHRAINGVNHLIACYQAVLGIPFNSKEEK